MVTLSVTNRAAHSKDKHKVVDKEREKQKDCTNKHKAKDKMSNNDKDSKGQPNRGKHAYERDDGRRLSGLTFRFSLRQYSTDLGHPTDSPWLSQSHHRR